MEQQAEAASNSTKSRTALSRSSPGRQSKINCHHPGEWTAVSLCNPKINCSPRVACFIVMRIQHFVKSPPKRFCNSLPDFENQDTPTVIAQFESFLILRFGLTFLVNALVGFVGIAVAAAGAVKFVLFLLLVTDLIFFTLSMWHAEESNNSRAAIR